MQMLTKICRKSE